MIILIHILDVKGQLSGNNLFEYQLGNLPYTQPSALSTHYDQLNLGYRYRALKVGLRYEHFLSQNEGSSYAQVSQFYAQYRKDKLDIKIGNFNETLGNGLLLRGYEITGSVFEEEAYRVRYGFYRDMFGFSAKYNGDIWDLQVVRGKSLLNTLPPTLPQEDRRIDLVEGVETGLTLHNQRVGMILMRNSNPVGQDLFYSLMLSGSFSLITYNIEYAHHLAANEPIFAANDDARFGFYGSMTFHLNGFGLSLEYKNYHDLLIGTGISDPPTTVKEHTYKVLNRSIHVPQLADESGFQLEGYYTFDRHQHLVVNVTSLLNQFQRAYRFRELFVEYTFYPGQKNTLSMFADYASDQFKSEDVRLAGGAVWEYLLVGRWSTQVHLEYQYIEREIAGIQNIHNGVVILGVSGSPALSVSMVWELSNDPYLKDNPTTPEIESGVRYWPGLEAAYRINQTNTISLFAGKRRGGPACTSGICYEVLDFEGIEIRLKTNF